MANQWEYCEIKYVARESTRKRRNLLDMWGGFDFFDILFFADGLGPQGIFDASPDFEGAIQTVTDRALIDDGFMVNQEPGRNKEAVSDVVTYLVQHGWEPLSDKGGQWYSHQFRRPSQVAALQATGSQEVQRAFAESERNLARNPGDANAWFKKGDALRNLKRYEEALVAYERALSRDPEHAGAQAWRRKGIAFDDLKRYEEALVAYERALSRDPKNAIVWALKGAVLYSLKRYEEAFIASDRALALDSTSKSILELRASMLRALGRTTEAEVAERRAKELGG